MNIENYVSTLEQSKKLDSLLGKRESIFYWIFIERMIHKWYLKPRINYETEYPGRLLSLDEWISSEKYNAYTSQEVEEIINKLVFSWTQNISPANAHPDENLKNFEFFFLKRFKLDEEISDIEKVNPDFNFQKYIIDGPFEAHARTEFLIYLLGSKSER